MDNTHNLFSLFPFRYSNGETSILLYYSNKKRYISNILWYFGRFKIFKFLKQKIIFMLSVNFAWAHEDNLKNNNSTPKVTTNMKSV